MLVPRRVSHVEFRSHISQSCSMQDRTPINCTTSLPFVWCRSRKHQAGNMISGSHREIAGTAHSTMWDSSTRCRRHTWFVPDQSQSSDSGIQSSSRKFSDVLNFWSSRNPGSFIFTWETDTWHFLTCSYLVPFLQKQPMHIHRPIQTVQETGKWVSTRSHVPICVRYHGGTDP